MLVGDPADPAASASRQHTRTGALIIAAAPSRSRIRPRLKLVAITVSGPHMILVICVAVRAGGSIQKATSSAAKGGLRLDGWVCLVAKSNRRVGRTLTMDHLAELPWAFTYLTPTAFTPAARQLQMLGIEPHVQMVVASFLALPFVIAGTERIALVQSRVAQQLTAHPDVQALPCPYDAVPISEAFWWHPMYERDPGHLWLRRYLADACGKLAVQVTPD
jgi:DNA-binding transcriptional LysR family regulator